MNTHESKEIILWIGIKNMGALLYIYAQFAHSLEYSQSGSPRDSNIEFRTERIMLRDNNKKSDSYNGGFTSL